MDKSKYTHTPGMRCAIALQEIGIAVTQDTQTLADFIDEKTAALELLEACKRAFDQTDKGARPADWEMLRAAIARATGAKS